jgi:hypothetical protein
MKTDQLIRTIDVRDRRGQVIGTKEVVTYQGLLSKAHEEGLNRIRTTLVQIPSDDNGRTAIAKAEVETGKGLYEALGDASPENVNSFIVPHLIRMAETRAKARALRDAVNIGVVSFEELDGEQAPAESLGAGSGAPVNRPARKTQNGTAQASTAPAQRTPGNGGPAPMSEAQRRYLFRILAGQGLQGDPAHEYLKELFEVGSLTTVSKSAAATMIDRLLSGEEVPSHGTLER